MGCRPRSAALARSFDGFERSVKFQKETYECYYASICKKYDDDMKDNVDSLLSFAISKKLMNECKGMLKRRKDENNEEKR